LSRIFIFYCTDWTHDATLLLISTYEENRYRFANPKLLKKDVWLDVSLAMSTNGYNYSGPDCAKKWSNMELRYCGYTSLLLLQLVF